MRILLKAMGFWIWGLIAISLSAALVTLSYRLASNYRWQTSPPVAAPSSTANFTPTPNPTGVAESVNAAAKGAMVSKVIGKEMKAARQALAERRWNDALDNLDAAQSKSPLTPDDVETIYDFKAFAYVRANNLKAAQTAYEAELATGVATTGETIRIFRTLYRIAAGTGQNSKAIDYGKKLADLGAIGPDDLVLMAQLFYLNKDCKDSAIWADKADAALREADEPPRENLYQFKLQCASEAGDTPGMTAAAADLIHLTGKANYWNTLLRIERMDERDDHNLLMIYRIMFDTSSMTVGTDFIEMAQLLGDAALPAEAQTVLEKAMSLGIINDQQKERTTRLLSSFTTRAEADKKGQAQLDTEATKNPAGELDVKLGEVYFGSGEYQNAVTALSRGLQKQQTKHLDDAYVYIGRAQVALKDTAAARTAFAQLRTVPNVSPRVLRIWSLYAETLGHPQQQPAAE